jgi:hypothetical protein
VAYRRQYYRSIVPFVYSHLNTAFIHMHPKQAQYFRAFHMRQRYSSWKFLIDFLEFPFLSAYVSMILQQNMLLVRKWTERSTVSAQKPLTMLHYQVKILRQWWIDYWGLHFHLHNNQKCSRPIVIVLQNTAFVGKDILDLSRSINWTHILQLDLKEKLMSKQSPPLDD